MKLYFIRRTPAVRDRPFLLRTWPDVIDSLNLMNFHAEEFRGDPTGYYIFRANSIRDVKEVTNGLLICNYPETFVHSIEENPFTLVTNGTQSHVQYMYPTIGVFSKYIRYPDQDMIPVVLSDMSPYHAGAMINRINPSRWSIDDIVMDGEHLCRATIMLSVGDALDYSVRIR